jgi:hypothetical protein
MLGVLLSYKAIYDFNPFLWSLLALLTLFIARLYYMKRPGRFRGLVMFLGRGTPLKVF